MSAFRNLASEDVEPWRPWAVLFSGAITVVAGFMQLSTLGTRAEHEEFAFELFDDTWFEFLNPLFGSYAFMRGFALAFIAFGLLMALWALISILQRARRSRA